MLVILDLADLVDIPALLNVLAYLNKRGGLSG